MAPGKANGLYVVVLGDGECWPCANTQGDHADAPPKGNGVIMGVILLGCETLPAPFTRPSPCSSGTWASALGTHDSTVYGTARAPPQRYCPHHLAAISSAVVSVL